MFKNYFKTTWRNITNNKTFSFLNILGLSIGIACACLIFLWVEYHIDFNKSISTLDRIYNVKNNQVYGKDMYTFSSTPFKIKDALETKIPGIESVSRFNNTGAVVSLGDKYLSQRGAYVDSGFMKMFDFPMVAGNKSSALTHETQVAISEKLAKTYFQDGQALNKTIMVNNNPYTVSAIFKDRSDNISFRNIDWLLPYNVFYGPHKDKPEDSWGNNWTDAWVLIKPQANIQNINAQLKDLVKRESPETENSLFLYPLNRMILYGNFTNGKEDPSAGQINYIRLFSIIAAIILFIACINFMNLSTARSERRAKEIGVRKVLGSGRKELVLKFLFESLIISYIAVLLAVAIVALTLPAFNSLINLQLKMQLFAPAHLLFLIAIGLVAGITAGSYPSLYLSSFKPIVTLKSNMFKNTAGASITRKGLVIVQFAISVIIIISVVVIYQQIQFSKNRDLGYKKDEVVYINASESLLKNFSALKQNILSTGVISSVTLSSASPMEMYSNGGNFKWKGKNEKDDVLITIVAADNNYNKTFGIKLKEGREFSDIEAQDSMNIIINESLAKLMGEEGKVGAQISHGGPPMTVIGITKDFVYNDINKLKADPLIFYHTSQYANQVFMRMETKGDVQQSLNKLQSAFKKTDPTTPFDYHFLDDDFANKFSHMKFINSLSIVFGGLAIFISCLGLFGLSAFMAERRTKEIGVRKVLGASVNSIVMLLSKEFLKLVIIACVVAFPVAYWMMHNWLQDYQYRVNVGWTAFAITGLTAMLLAFLTVGFQTLKAAVSNPVKSLRTE